MVSSAEMTLGDRRCQYPCWRRFVRLQEARDNGVQTVSAIRPDSERAIWLKNRTNQITDNLDELQHEIARLGHPSLFGPNSYPESHRFFGIQVVEHESDFATFINTCNRCFVEPIESYGRSIGAKDYFWKVIKETYPALGMALRRIKIYRHDRVHIKLIPS